MIYEFMTAELFACICGYFDELYDMSCLLAYGTKACDSMLCYETLSSIFMLCSAQQGFVLIVVLWYFRVAVDYYMPNMSVYKLMTSISVLIFGDNTI